MSVAESIVMALLESDEEDFMRNLVYKSGSVPLSIPVREIRRGRNQKHYDVDFVDDMGNEYTLDRDLTVHPVAYVLWYSGQSDRINPLTGKPYWNMEAISDYFGEGWSISKAVREAIRLIQIHASKLKGAGTHKPYNDPDLG